MPKGGFRVWAAHAQVLQVRASGDLQQSSCRGEADIQEQAVWGNWHLPYCHYTNRGTQFQMQPQKDVWGVVSLCPGGSTNFKDRFMVHRIGGPRQPKVS